jgi:hypothetical protein
MLQPGDAIYARSGRSRANGWKRSSKAAPPIGATTVREW